jgi:hypothetical protein
VRHVERLKGKKLTMANMGGAVILPVSMCLFRKPGGRFGVGHMLKVEKLSACASEQEIEEQTIHNRTPRFLGMAAPDES